MSRVLFVTLENPFSFGGGSQATRAYLDSVIDIYGANQVTVFGWDNYEIPTEYSNVKFERIIKNNIFKEYFLGFISLDITRLGRYIIKYLHINKTFYKICIINNGVLAGYITPRLLNTNIKTCVIHHNQEVEFNIDSKSRLTLGGRITYLVRYNERKAFKCADINVFLTQQDLDFMRQMYGNHRGVLSLLGTYDFKNAIKVKPIFNNHKYDIVISGSLQHIQNVEGIRKVMNNFMPIINKIIPNNKILIVGKNPTNYIKELKSNYNNITVIGNPINIMDYVGMGKIYLCPTDCGSGLKLRVMDGLKCGKPILVHKISARGYDKFFSKDYFNIYHDEKSFELGLKKIINLMNSSSSSYSSRINFDYQAYFGYNAGTERLKKILDL